jgi:5-formyltetrahydrofolate cyclo-ligase
MNMPKSKLRADLISRRKTYVKEQKKVWHADHAWPDELFALTLTARCVAGYMPVGSEADATSLLDELSRRGVPLALPYLATRTSDLIFKQYVKRDILETAIFGFKQPAEEAAIAEPDVILTPLVGFDVTMARLGQGAGHYDRAFTRHPDALRIGIAWSIQQVERMPTDPWDVALDAVLTEKDWIIGKNSRIAR